MFLPPEMTTTPYLPYNLYKGPMGAGQSDPYDCLLGRAIINLNQTIMRLWGRNSDMSRFMDKPQIKIKLICIWALDIKLKTRNQLKLMLELILKTDDLERWRERERLIQNWSRHQFDDVVE